MDRTAKRVSPKNIEKDRYTYNAVQSVTGYKPAKDTLALAQLQAAYKKLDDLQRLETQKEAEFKAARDNAVAQEHAFHDLMLAVHDQIRAQFGADSNEYQSLGMVKKSEYKKRTPAKS